MNKRFGFLHWTPRILGVLFIIFISLFALDVFEEGHAWWELLLGFLIHLIPSYFLAAALIIAWRRPGLGGLLFLAVALGFIVRFNLVREWISFMLIAVPPLLIGALFLADWQLQRTRPGTASS
jgi:hypothetical protein